MPRKRPTPPMRAMLLDPNMPDEMRRHLLLGLLQDESEAAQEAVKELLAAARRSDAESHHQALASQLEELLEELRGGALRCATFLGLAERDGHAMRARLRLPDGQVAFCVVPDEELARSLRVGEDVWIDTQASAVHFRDPGGPPIGDQATLERVLPDGRVEVRGKDESLSVYLCSWGLTEQLDAGEVATGDTIVVCPHRQLAYTGLPPMDGLSHFRYLQRLPVPDVLVERDVGCPPAFIDELSQHVARELEDPGLGRRYDLHRARTWLLSGLPGTGKSLSILALWRRVYEIVAAHTGVAVDELPPRVMRLRLSEVVSHWFGDTDRNVARFFTEVEELAATPWVGFDGREHELPVIVVCEEIDGLARRRGESEIHDRVLTTTLERLDMNHPGLRDKVILFVFTTNATGLVDAAFLRRAGGKETVFGPLDERGFSAVLGKQLRKKPVATRNGESQEVARAATVDAVTAWLFSRNGDDPGQVELHWVGSASPQRWHRRDMLTGGLVERSVQAAAAAACEAERQGTGCPGIAARGLMLAIDEQVRAMVQRLEPGNVAQHLLLPEGQRVARVRVLPAAALPAAELLRDPELQPIPVTGDPS